MNCRLKADSEIKRKRKETRVVTWFLQSVISGRRIAIGSQIPFVILYHNSKNRSFRSNHFRPFSVLLWRLHVSRTSLPSPPLIWGSRMWRATWWRSRHWILGLFCNGEVKSCYEMSDFWNINMDDELRHIHSYQSGHRLFLPSFFVVSFSPSRQKTTQCIEFSHERFLIHVF